MKKFCKKLLFLLISCGFFVSPLLVMGQAANQNQGAAEQEGVAVLVGDGFYTDYVRQIDIQTGAEIARFENMELCQSSSQAGTRCEAVAVGGGSPGAFIQSILTWAIGLASIAAVGMIIFNGFRYVASAGTKETSKARDGIRNAVLGLILLIASVFILRFINPTLVQLDVALTPIDIGQYIIYSESTEKHCSYFTPERGPAYKAGDCYSSEDECEQGRQDKTSPNRYECKVEVTEVSYGSCGDGQECTGFNDGRVELGSNSGITCGNNPDGSGECLVNTDLYECLADLNLPGLSPWRVTEAWPPSVKHSNPCHQNGTCVDVNFKSNPPTEDEVVNFINTAKSLGLKPVYEVKNKNSSLYAALQERVPAENLDVVAHATASHFSIYMDDRAKMAACR